MGVTSDGFIHEVATRRDLVVTRPGDHVFRLAPRALTLAWHCDLDDGTPTGDNDPASYVRWVGPGLGTPGPGAAGAQLDVRRVGPRSDLGRLLGRLSGRSSGSADGRSGGLAYTDPAGVLDAGLRDRIEHWPDALHGDGRTRPAELLAIRVGREGLIVESVSWWGSAAALDHQILLAVDLATRLTSMR